MGNRLGIGLAYLVLVCGCQKSSIQVRATGEAARDTVLAYIRAARDADTDALRRVSAPGSSVVTQSDELQGVHGDVSPGLVTVNGDRALVASSGVRDNRGRPGFVVFLLRAERDDTWRIRDIDFEELNAFYAKLEHFERAQ